MSNYIYDTSCEFLLYIEHLLIDMQLLYFWNEQNQPHVHYFCICEKKLCCIHGRSQTLKCIRIIILKACLWQYTNNKPKIVFSTFLKDKWYIFLLSYLMTIITQFRLNTFWNFAEQFPHTNIIYLSHLMFCFLCICVNGRFSYALGVVIQQLLNHPCYDIILKDFTTFRVYWLGY